MKYYIRNSFTKICFHNEDFLITGGFYNKKIKASLHILEILKKTSKAIKEEDLLAYLNMKFKISFEVGEKLLSKLLNLGFLETNTIYSLKHKEYKSSDSTKIKSLNIPTYLRPSELSKCIKSYFENFQRNSHYIDYYVFDDTPLDKSNENYMALKNVKHSLNTDIFYIDLEAKERFIEILARECGLEKTLIEFAFMPNKIFKNQKLFMSGANRNFILAYTIGDCFLTADDDSCCLGFESNVNSHIYFSTGRGNIDKQYIKDKDLGATLCNENLDILNLHQQYLGKSLGEILYQKEIKEITFDMITSENDIFPNNYNFYETSRVHFTFNTTLGWPDQTADEVLCDYLHNKDMDYLLGLSNKTILEKSKGDTIYSSPFLLTTTLTGIDNRKAICPFMPVYRNEDVHYGYFLNYLDPYSLSSSINVSLLHDKKKSPHQLEAFYKNFYGDIVLSYILYQVLNKLKIQLPNEYLDIDNRKIIFSRSIKNICGKDQFEFTNNLLEIKIDLNKLWQEKRDLVNVVHSSFEDNKTHADINQYFTDFNKFITSEEWELMRRVLILYSDLLLQWHSIMEACYRLKIAGKLPKKIM